LAPIDQFEEVFAELRAHPLGFKQKTGANPRSLTFLPQSWCIALMFNVSNTSMTLTSGEETLLVVIEMKLIQDRFWKHEWDRPFPLLLTLERRMMTMCTRWLGQFMDLRTQECPHNILKPYRCQAKT
jgi:hypothetical protein